MGLPGAILDRIHACAGHWSIAVWYTALSDSLGRSLWWLYSVYTGIASLMIVTSLQRVLSVNCNCN